MITKSTLTAIAAFAAVAISAGAFAAPAAAESDVVSVKVSLADVDMGSPAGAQVALRRIHAAAGQICGEESGDRLTGHAQYRACLDQITDRAVARLGSPMVTALNGFANGHAKVVVSASR
jgi:UrcA family protein